MKKQILIVSYSMGIGGVERALLGLLNSIDYTQADVTLKLARKKGELLKDVPDNVNIEQIDCINDNWEIFNKPLIPIIARFLKRPKSILKGLRLCSAYILSKIQGHYHSLFKSLLKKDSRIYDIAISYAGPSSLLDYYVAKCITAKKKVAWIHYDLNKFAINKKSIQYLHSFFDKIFVVSNEGKRIYDTIFPEEKSKSEVFHNLINPQDIKALASSITESIFSKEGLNCVCVGRLSVEKGQDLAIRAVADLIKRGFNINLTLVGEGKFRLELEELTKELKVSEHIHFAGSSSNPYPYMEQCDIYLQPSRHEGYCITLAEARLFGKPIVATNFTGAAEQLQNYQNSFITPHVPLDIADTIEKIIRQGLYLQRHPISVSINSDYIKLTRLLQSC